MKALIEIIGNGRVSLQTKEYSGTFQEVVDAVRIDLLKEDDWITATKVHWVEYSSLSLRPRQYRETDQEFLRGFRQAMKMLINAI